jgi:hypothetical protein
LGRRIVGSCFFVEYLLCHLSSPYHFNAARYGYFE